MRISISVLIIAFVATSSVQAQSVRNLTMRELVELSRAERARRAGKPAEGRVYTSDDIERYVPPVAEGEPPGEPSDGETEAADSEDFVAEDRDALGEGFLAVPSDIEDARTLWQEAIADTRLEIQQLEDTEVRQQLAMTEIQGIITAPIGTQQERNRARTDLAVAQATLVEIQAQRAEATAELEALEAQEPVLDDQ